MPDRGKFLVTGAAGLIGSAVIWALNQRGDERIIAVDRLDRTEKWRNLAPLRFDDYIDADALGDKIELGLLNEVRAVVHLGACSSTTETDARYLVENNCNYTKMLAEWTLQRGIRFVYASSAATYGAIEGRVSEEDRSITALRPLNMYGYSKQLFDLHRGEARLPRPHRRAEVLQRLRPERKSQRRHAERRQQGLPADSGVRAGAPVQELPS